MLVNSLFIFVNGLFIFVNGLFIFINGLFFRINNMLFSARSLLRKIKIYKYLSINKIANPFILAVFPTK